MLVALYDANVLYSASLRDLLIRLAQAKVVGARWSDTIHEEWIASLLRDRRDLTRAQLDRTRTLMEEALPGARVQNFEHLVPSLRLPDPGDRHVLAAAITGEATRIVTANTRDFPHAELRPYGIKAVEPDRFVMLLLRSEAQSVVAVLRDLRGALHRPPRSVEAYLAGLEKVGLKRTVEHLRRSGADL